MVAKRFTIIQLRVKSMKTRVNLRMIYMLSARYVLLCDLFNRFSICLVDSKLNSVWRVSRSLNKSSDGVTASVVSNLRISFVSCSSFILWRFLCCALYDIICPLRYAFMDSHTVKGDIPGVWLCSRKKVISEEIHLMKSSSESNKVLSRQGW